MERKNNYVERDGVREHRLVAAQMLGRPLLPGEVVHHKNGVKWDNRPENLEVLPSQGEHMRRHVRVADDEVVARLLAGETTASIAADGVSQHRLVRIRAELGIEKGRRIVYHPAPSRRVLDWEEAIRLRAEGVGVREIGRRLGVSHVSVRYATDPSMRERKRAKSRG